MLKLVPSHHHRTQAPRLWLAGASRAVSRFHYIFLRLQTKEDFDIIVQLKDGNVSLKVFNGNVETHASDRRVGEKCLKGGNYAGFIVQPT
jgi:hypothetical protein